MPPRFAYWTILAGGLPTAFRAAHKEELLPTFRRLKDKHPDAELKYFARGKLWESQDEARRALQRPPRAASRQQQRDGRDRDWRPGGDHRDPRQRFKDAKKARNRDRRQERWQRKRAESRPFDKPPGRPPRTKPHGDRFRDEVPRRPFNPRANRRFAQNQETPPPPQRPPRPDREPPPGRDPKPEPPPRPSEPTIKPPGPPERGGRHRSPGRRRDR